MTYTPGQRKRRHTLRTAERAREAAATARTIRADCGVWMNRGELIEMLRGVPGYLATWPKLERRRAKNAASEEGEG